jgi:hypothetical protein
MVALGLINFHLRVKVKRAIISQHCTLHFYPDEEAVSSSAALSVPSRATCYILPYISTVLHGNVSPISKI